MSDDGVIVVKVGGEVAADERAVRDLAADMRGDGPWLLVHGGGAEVTDLSRRLGLEPQFRDGVRMTSAAEMDVVDMILSGLVNKRLVRRLQAAGLDAVGLSGSDGRVLRGRSIGKGNRTGDVGQVEPRLLAALLREGFLPVLCSTSMDREGVALNINADTAALAVARALKARTLVFVSNVPGVLKAGEVMPKLTRELSLREIERGTITGGMIPKVQACLGALESGVGSIVIGDLPGPGSLAALVCGARGTRITEE